MWMRSPSKSEYRVTPIQTIFYLILINIDIDLLRQNDVDFMVCKILSSLFFLSILHIFSLTLAVFSVSVYLNVPKTSLYLWRMWTTEATEFRIYVSRGCEWWLTVFAILCLDTYVCILIWETRTARIGRETKTHRERENANFFFLVAPNLIRLDLPVYKWYCIVLYCFVLHLSRWIYARLSKNSECNGAPL